MVLPVDSAQALEESILRTLIYADIFDFPLKMAEIHHFLIGLSATPEAVETCLRESTRLAEILDQTGEYWALRGRESLAHHRLARDQVSARLWEPAQRYGALLAALPFVRMVALTGALSMRNAADTDDDIDYMLITARGRVWLARLLAVIVVRLVRLRGIRLCPNYVLAEHALPQARHDLYMAHELAQMIPLAGRALYDRMRAANAWTAAYLPNASDPLHPVPDRQPRGLGRWVQRGAEWLLGGAIGSALDAWEMRRKQRKFQRESIPVPSRSAAQLDADHVKGHFQDHGARILARYEAGLVRYHLAEPPSEPEKDTMPNPATNSSEPPPVVALNRALRSTTAERPDILLVNPLFVAKDPMEQQLMTPYFPLGLMYLASVLRRENYSVAMYDGAFEPEYDSFDAAMQRLKPRVVGITALITVRRNALRLAEIAKKHGATVIFGGPDPTGKPEAYLKHTDAEGRRVVDVVVWDEGEVTLIELMNHLTGRGGADLLSWAQIRGLRYLDDSGTLISTPRRPAIEDLDALPFPSRDLIDVDAYREHWTRAHGYWSLSIINTRGCPYACTWCQKGIFGRSYRSRSAASVAEEMRQIKTLYNPDQIRVVDDITGVDRDWVFEWREEVLRRDAVIPFECLSRVNLVDVPMLTALKEIGCQKIFFGAESGSQKVLNAMKKGSKVEQIYRAAEACQQVGIHVYYFMMVGYPGEEMDDLRLSVKLLTETLPDSFSTTIAYPLPGTEFYQQVRDRIMHDGDDWAFTAENKLLFERGKYNTVFYRWVQRWFNKEWEVARMRAGKLPASPIHRVRSELGLRLSRAMVGMIARVPGGTTIEFKPAPGR